MRGHFLLTILTIAWPTISDAQVDAQLLEIRQGEAISIAASETVEWLQDKRQYIANGKVRIQKGQSTLTADHVVADYQMFKGKPQVQRLSATGNVVIADKTATAKGQGAEYQVGQNIFRLFGGDAALITPEFTVTAAKEITFWPKQQRAQATGGAVVTRKADASTLAATTIEVFFRGTPEKKMTIERVKATGNVRIQAGDKEATSARGSYHAQNGLVTLQEGVRLMQGKSLVEGETATLNIPQKTTTITGGAQRVQGILTGDAFTR